MSFNFDDMRALQTLLSDTPHRREVVDDNEEDDDDIEDQHFGRRTHAQPAAAKMNPADYANIHGKFPFPSAEEAVSRFSVSTKTGSEAVSDRHAPHHSVEEQKSMENEDVSPPQELDVDDDDAFGDNRAEPQYKTSFSQSVTVEDCFLGTTNKTPATSSCENFSVKISLPNTDKRDILCDVVQNGMQLKCTTPKFKLKLPLPHRVDKDRSRGAQWDSIKQELTVTLRMCRESDFLNE